MADDSDQEARDRRRALLAQASEAIAGRLVDAWELDRPNDLTDREKGDLVRRVAAGYLEQAERIATLTAERDAAVRERDALAIALRRLLHSCTQGGHAALAVLAAVRQDDPK